MVARKTAFATHVFERNWATCIAHERYIESAFDLTQMS